MVPFLVRHLAAVARVVQEARTARLADEPVHGGEDVVARGEVRRARVRVVGERHHG